MRKLICRFGCDIRLHFRVWDLAGHSARRRLEVHSADRSSLPSSLVVGQDDSNPVLERPAVLSHSVYGNAVHPTFGDRERRNKGVSSSKGSTMILLIRRRGEESQKPMAIKIKLFSKEDVERLFDLLGPKFKSSRQIGIYTDESA